MIGETKELVANVPTSSGDKMQTLQEFSINLTKLAQEVVDDFFFLFLELYFWSVWCRKILLVKYGLSLI